MKHKHADLLRMAADNADQLFECDELNYKGYIEVVIKQQNYNWRPVKTTKKIKRWLWADKDGECTVWFFSDSELDESSEFKIKLLWSETEFEVEDAH